MGAPLVIRYNSYLSYVLTAHVTVTGRILRLVLGKSSLDVYALITARRSQRQKRSDLSQLRLRYAWNSITRLTGPRDSLNALVCITDSRLGCEGHFAKLQGRQLGKLTVRNSDSGGETQVPGARLQAALLSSSRIVP
ncbi:uncharacterized protein BDR25DRAFT_355292 [Lindgomyces ingoldianus]|uniref:Uncharacterized protein n=1 Tax=Lindgomyces ingoldianus TaxID=673940 RepID=A0ACB6QV24_9PLEO|nr:uncharacterized protein BDR25DRAFT_355292 [Lindgomyces ingoldianus]KAF2470806.1 hypothetical protein BDR25DRAFT_355292 [Lindgomyces ingoldianus]